MSGGAISGLCDSGCVTLVPYAILIFITTFTICMGTSPIVAILIRYLRHGEHVMEYTHNQTL